MSLTVAIIGAGFGGLCMAIQLEKAGIHSYTIFEKGPDVGGTWRDNTYPGAGCDVPSHLYSFSFEKYSSWTRRYPEQPEILGYLEMCADKYGLRPRLRLNTEVTAAAFDESLGRWRVRTSAGEELFDVVVSAVGQLNRPRMPDIAGMPAFEGAAFHSARWDHSQDLTGRRVAVIGNGSSAAQLIPRVAAVAGRVDVFQRTPNWVIPKSDATFGDALTTAFRRLPLLQRGYREWIYRYAEGALYPALAGGWSTGLLRKIALGHLHDQVPDPELRAKLTPDYPIGCKRIVIDSAFYPALTRPNVNVVTDRITRIAPGGVETATGLHEADVIVYATGFHASDFLAPIEITGREGHRLDEEWKDGAEAYLGIAVPRFPNLFMLYGPNTNLGHSSIVFMIECQVGYIMGCLPYIARRGSMEVRPEAMDTWRRSLNRAMGTMIWQAGCTSWYKNAAGRVTNNWPEATTVYRRITKEPRPGAFRFAR
ncbi:flavin-containing monooxygenase [Streptosporangium lutulentum]|uniref:Cation diffusion facilitator CzcD-associated flavoprotein CzcO n=1 Tax=Streptosporangium lutulentum TaxID=1461250 RepID=A0ABT9Q2Y7_9ACTN|nr:NAD(P)/FAD-dependent oxidoreductase [Streptosporangium lutulentum]MDP9841090.1 cation diffusion facilitator CzcD-associated flavoprotein CzcO [Streptosporangium lutulentum]